ncbi:PREDICTED: disco-interacting protein 2 homolog B-A-like [Nicrophorus vespilloides]|uniref:Disco-interacting protein 2 homolog B-A-like n=1 Tax=Nicrophorus vespilloides TaxID=110193 RepID=A0ABM1MVM0_NICVS|nr:PREDICTED: disco-interacting protein 2 homolog B-A-like [Nicrophorus vespilloides]
MADLNIDVSELPEDVREKLAELELELSEESVQGISHYHEMRIDLEKIAFIDMMLEAVGKR